MIASIKRIFGKDNKEVRQVAKEQLRKNLSAIESLRDYDTGKKDISTSDVEKRLRNIRVAQ